MKDLITILGPTASGKTAVAVAVAQAIGGEILSADSRQVYRGMDIGTGKDLSEYGDIPHHLIDICDAGEKYNLFRYQEDFETALADVRSRDAYPILCGGTGLYIESVLQGYSLPQVPQNSALRAKLEGKPLAELAAMLAELKKKHGSALHNTTDIDTAQRAIRAIEIEMAVGETEGAASSTTLSDEEKAHRQRLIFGISIGREQRRQQITKRLERRLANGMVDEVQHLLDSGIAADDLIYYGLEYKYLTEYCTAQRSYDDMFRHLNIAIHQFAKRQMTWFRGMERRGFNIRWLDVAMPMEEKIATIINATNEKSN